MKFWFQIPIQAENNLVHERFELKEMRKKKKVQNRDTKEVTSSDQRTE